MKRRPQLSIDELHQVRWLLGGFLTVLSAWTVSFMDVDATLLLGVTTVLVPTATLSPALAAWFPIWMHRLTFPLMVAFFLCDLILTRQPLPALIRLDLMLLLYRGVTLRRRREDLQLIVLALFLVIVAGVVTVSLAFIAQILLFMACTLALLLVLTITESMPEPPINRGGLPPSWTHVRWLHLFRRLLQVANWRAVTLGVFIFTAVVGLSAVLFLSLPRFEMSGTLFIDRFISKKTRTGFSENVRIGDVVNIQEDRSVALSIDVSDRAAVPATPYWRMLILDRYSSRGGGGGFSMSEGLRAEMRTYPTKMQQFVGGLSVLRRDPDHSVTWTFYMEPGVSRYLPMLGDFRLLTFNDAQQLTSSNPLRLHSLSQESSKMLPYRVEGMVVDYEIPDLAYAARWKEIVARPLEPDSNEPERRRGGPGFGMGGFGEDFPGDYGMGMMGEDMQGRPPPPPDYLALHGLRRFSRAKLYGFGTQIGHPRDGDVAAFVQRASEWLHKRHGYSLRFTIDRGDLDERFRPDPLVTWMESNENGHCEMFAGSMVLLARAAGIPSRLVTGFKGAAWNTTSGHISVRNSDAHAWCELFDYKRGVWLRVDPTPGASILPVKDRVRVLRNNRPNLDLESGWSSRTDSLRVFWYRRIVSFDQTSQLELVRLIKEAVEGLGTDWRAQFDKKTRSLGVWLREPWTWWRVGLSAAFAGGIVMTIWLWRELGVGLWLRSLRSADPVRREASRWLARLNHAKGPFALQVRERLLRLRYGAKRSWREPATRVFRDARRAVRALDRQ
ncbi:transglutaminaseTgpA domain-containing protein [Geminisphaera colitermitum]|uniref:transglutaminase family protein n=1 Tax=Geminisphaera colitermitum TaxID=1148786 RepID=UPI00019651CE|nr:DUF3488 and transglutaminase-like domain-containing protein [Geminisphaera colitermitum]